MNKDNMFFTCTCGCNNSVSIKELDGNIYISFLSDDFFTNQKVFTNLFKLPNLFIGKDTIKDIILTEDDIKNLINALNVPCNNNPVQNYSHIKVKYDYACPESGMFFLELKSDLPISMILRGKYYKNFEITLNETEKNRLIKMLKIELKRKKYFINKKMSHT